MQPTLDANFHSYFVIMPCIEQISLAKISYRLFQRSYQYAITSDVDKTVTSDMKTCLKLQDQKTSSKYETKTKTCKFETKTLNFISFAKHFQKIKKKSHHHIQVDLFFKFLAFYLPALVFLTCRYIQQKIG